MEIVDNILLKPTEPSSSSTHRSSLFHKGSNVLFCKNCGVKYDRNNFMNGNGIIDFTCSINECKSKSYVNGDFANTLAGYIELRNKGTLKLYCKERNKKSSIRVNSKRLVIWLLIRDKFISVDDKEIQKFVYSALWKGGKR